ncbi:LacI family DNA-binding transcriptional regulator [Candidatus Enterococcus murrayae]|uniref:LacI family DNA-binding transcriptional regulator n=1 Tax=Candidatus Enterococcus murrayae TaxID=2815321 RepID=A0ABS3HIK3_9ENTE|nr:LacI family DNA-binding transcriptional regulator [Enterococcus sp. MJM16]MBO0452715.1 LacI family DNA-binding transcriptional regulator [Enterococcus sp. MJM16]
MASIRDIAKLAGVSAASVSRILNNDETFSINENTRKRVIEIATSLNYSKNQNRKNRDVGDKNTIALITRHQADNEKSDPYFMFIRKGVESEAKKWRLKTFRAFSMRDKEKDIFQLSKYGAVVVIGEMTLEALEEIRKINSNIVLIDSYSEYAGFDCVQTDFAQKTHDILDLLKSKGHENIAFIGGLGSKVDIHGEVVYYKEEIRSENYRQWMVLNHLDNYTTVLQGEWSPGAGLELGTQIMNMNPRPTAIVVASDPMAVGVYKAVINAGLSIPEDISIISFDDIEMAQYMTPSLSTVRLNSEEVGKIGVELVRGKLLNVRAMPVRVVCSSELILRDSVNDIKNEEV